MALVRKTMTPPVAAYLVVNCILGALSIGVVVLRMMARRLGPGIGIDDWLILLALPLALCGVVFQSIHSTLGIGYEMDQHPELLNNIVFLLKVIYAQQIIYMLALAAVKMSVLFFYRRLFTVGAVRRAIMATMGVTISWLLAFVFAAAFLCDPPRKQWDTTVPGHCGDQIAMDEAMVVTNMFTDVIIMVLPMPTIWTLKLKLREKLALTAAFSLGVLVIVAGIFRCVYLQVANLATNLTGTLPPSIFVSQIEPLLGVVCVSIPMLGPLYKRYYKGYTDNSDYTPPRYGDSGGSHARAKSSSGRRPSQAWELEHHNQHHHHQGGDLGVYNATVYAKGGLFGAGGDDTGSERSLHGAAAPHGITVETGYTVTRK